MIDPTAACSTTRKGLICKGFRCAKLMIEMEARNDSRLREGVDRRPVARSAACFAGGWGAEKVYAEKVSGAVTERRALARAIAALAPGDVLLVTKLDRLARSTRDLLNTLDAAKSLGEANDHGASGIG